MTGSDDIPSADDARPSTGTKAIPLGREKNVLYHASDPAQLEDLLVGMRAVDGCEVYTTERTCVFEYDGFRVHIVPEYDARRAMDRIHNDYFNVIVVDVRDLEGRPGQLTANLQSAIGFLDALGGDHDIETRYGFHRVITLLRGANPERVDQMIANLGKRGVGKVLRDASACSLCQDADRTPRKNRFSQTLLDELIRMLSPRTRGKFAVCAAGGGITGLYFELGALKCVDDCLPGRSLNEADMYFGISAGAVATSMLANGYSVDEFMAAVAGVSDGRIPPMSLNLLRLRHLNYHDLLERIGGLTKLLAAGMVAKVPRRRRRLLGSNGHDSLLPAPPGRNGTQDSFDFVFESLGDTLPAPFHARGFEEYLRELFSKHGTVNDFRKLPRPLYVGATDQDRRTHVLFGDERHDSVPISEAIHASMSFNPAFSAARVGNRYYEDGAVTRTSNFLEAIRRGSDLVVIVDPFVPYVSKRPGFAARKGIFYNVDQNVRAISYTRFDNARHEALRNHPAVSTYTFLPANRLRELMSANPLGHRPYLEIWRGSYLSTFQRIERLRYRMSGDFASHGITLDTARAEQVADRLTRIEQPTFADFFPEGRIDLRVPDRPLLRDGMTPEDES